MCIGKVFVNYYLVIPARIWEPALSYIQTVHERFAAIRDGNDFCCHRFGKTFDIQLDIDRNPGFNLVDAGNILNLFFHAFGRPLQVKKDISKTVVTIKRVPGQIQGIHGADEHDESSNPAHYNQRNRKDLPFHAPDIPPQFSVKSSHWLTIATHQVIFSPSGFGLPKFCRC